MYARRWCDQNYQNILERPEAVWLHPTCIVVQRAMVHGTAVNGEVYVA